MVPVLQLRADLQPHERKTTKARRHQEQQLIFASRDEPMFIVEDTPKELCRNYYERAEWRGTLCAFVPWWFAVAVAVGMPVVQ